MVILLGIAGHVTFQLGFILGLDWTLTGNAALLLSTSPVWGRRHLLRAGPGTSQSRDPRRGVRDPGRHGDPDHRRHAGGGDRTPRRPAGTGRGDLVGSLHGFRTPDGATARRAPDDRVDAVGGHALHHPRRRARSCAHRLELGLASGPGSGWSTLGCSRSASHTCWWYQGVRTIGQNRTSIYQNLVSGDRHDQRVAVAGRNADHPAACGRGRDPRRHRGRPQFATTLTGRHARVDDMFTSPSPNQTHSTAEP